MRIIGKSILVAAALVIMALTAPTAHADTGACVSYLEDSGQDTTVRVQICANTETIADVISQQVALAVCVPLMTLTGLPEPSATIACTLAVAP